MKGRKWLLATVAGVLLAAVACGGMLWMNGWRSDAESAQPGNSAELGLVLLNGENGVYVLAVSDPSPASLAGVQPGDRILQANGMEVPDTDTLNRLLQQRRMPMQLTVRRQEQLFTLTLSGN